MLLEGYLYIYQNHFIHIAMLASGSCQTYCHLHDAAGKSYIGTRLVQVLTANTQPRLDMYSEQPMGLLEQASLQQAHKAVVGPMLVLTYTNHALDQFLLDLLKHGIKGIVRVGGNSKTEVLQPYNLHELTKGAGSTGSPAGRRLAREAHQYALFWCCLLCEPSL